MMYIYKVSEFLTPRQFVDDQNSVAECPHKHSQPDIMKEKRNNFACNSIECSCLDSQKEHSKS